MASERFFATIVSWCVLTSSDLTGAGHESKHKAAVSNVEDHEPNRPLQRAFFNLRIPFQSRLVFVLCTIVYPWDLSLIYHISHKVAARDLRQVQISANSA